MGAVSARSGFPNSSIYWHFSNKDELIAAVIDRSWVQSNAAFERPAVVPDGADGCTMFREAMRNIARRLVEYPLFLRLGLMLILDLNPQRANRPGEVLADPRDDDDPVA